MTIKVKFSNGVFTPVAPIQDFDLEEGSELDIEILSDNRKHKLKGIIGLFDNLSEKEIQQFEETAKRQPLFEKAKS